MSFEELNDKLGRWNPMETDYANAEFNQYISGPGADLDAELQPGQQALQKNAGCNTEQMENQPVPSLIFKNLPVGMTTNALKNMCSRHGRVRDVRDSTKNAYYFVDMVTVSDMEAVLRALENNNYGFKIMVGKKNKSQSGPEINKNQQSFNYVPPNNNGIDYQSRSYRTSNKSHPRPKVEEDTFLNETDAAKAGMSLNILSHDAHSLERQGLYKMANDNKFNYHQGRSYVSMPKKTKQFIDKKHKESSGAYNQSEDKFVHSTLWPNEMGIGKCSQCYYACDTVCERCNKYYCSLECQQSDWPDHRYICGKPKHLQRTPPSKINIQTGNNFATTQKESNKMGVGKEIVENAKDKVMKKISPEKLTKSPNNIQLPTSSKMSIKNTNSLKPTTQQFQNSSKALCEQLPTKISSSHKLAVASRPPFDQFPKPAVETSSHERPTSSKVFSEQFPTTSKPFSKKLPAALRATFNQISKPPVETSSHEHSTSSKDSSTPFPTTSKSSSKNLPAALRTSFYQVSNSPVETFQQLPLSTKASPQQLSDSSTVSQNNSNKKLNNDEDIYKQNMPRSGNIVKITAISKTNLVFIRSTTYDGNESYFNTVDTIKSIGKLLQPLKTLPESGEVVIAKFEEQFNRALILKVFNSTKILIHLMDFGNMEQAKIEDLFEAPKEFKYKPRHAIPVLLKDVADFYMTQETRKFMYSYLNNINLEIRYKAEDFRQDSKVYAVELIDENTQQHFNKMIMKLSKPVEPQNINEICDQDYLERKLLPVGKNVELFVMDNSLMCSGCISCTTKPFAIEIDKFKKDIRAYVESIPKAAYTPRVNELCIAKYEEDGFWYRGRCLETVGDGHPSILFIDYGNITLVPIESIRKYPRQFTFPIYTADCIIEGLPEFCDDELVAKLEDVIPNGGLIKCENVSCDEDSNFYTLSLPNVIRALNKQ